MTKKWSLQPSLLLLGIPISLLVFLIGLVLSPWNNLSSPAFSIALTLDFIVTIPLVYFLVIRKQGIPKITVLSVFIIGLLLASYVLPPEQQSFLQLIKTVAFPLAELGILFYVIQQARRTIKAFKEQGKVGQDFFTAIRSACEAVLPARLANLLAMEIAVIYYLFFGRSRRLEANEYTYHRKSGIRLVLIVFIGLVLAETFVMHLLVERWSVVVAWCLSFLSLYSCIQISALLRSMSQRFIRLDLEEEKLYLRYGFFNESTIKLNAIERIELTARSLPEDKGMVQFSPLGILDSHNMILYLREEQELQGIYGMKKNYRILSLYVDEKVRFQKQISTYLDQLV